MVEVTYKRPRRRMQGTLRLPRKREWKAAKSSLLTAGWLQWNRPIDADLRHNLESLRARSRSEAQNNDHVKHFLRLVKTNVVGRQGITLQGRVMRPSDEPDEIANTAIEEAWKDWGRRGQADVTGQLSWRDIQRQFIETLARDGEAIYRMVFRWEDNPYRFALQPIDPETLDIQHNAELVDGRRIIMGVEVDQWRRPIAYWLNEEPRTFQEVRPQRNPTRVPADQILHCYLPEWVWQTRGVPWMATPLQRLHMLDGYEEAEVTAARVAAAKMGFYKQSPEAAGYTGDSEDSQNNPVQDVRPGENEILPPGWDFEGWDPQHPNAQYGDFVKSVLRAISSGLGVNYNTLANDLEGVNYTSLRHGSLTERDVWMLLQDWMIESFCDRVYRNWINTAVVAQAIVGNGRPLSSSRLDDFYRVSWQPRRWPWVDPLKETQANREAYEMRTRSLGDIIREQGRDPEEVWQEIQRENDLLESMGISPPAAKGAAVSAEPNTDQE